MRYRICAIAMALLAQAGWSISPEGWVRVESPHFRLYGQQEPEALKKMAVELELFREMVIGVTGTAVPGDTPPLDVFVASGNTQFRELSNMDTNMLGGLYHMGYGGERFAITRGWGDDEFARQVLFHEYVHEIMLYNTHARYPKWYSEGFADYLAGGSVTDRYIRFGEPPEYYVKNLGFLGWQPYNMLMNRDSVADSWLDSFYPQSWLAVHFFMSDEKRKQWLVQYLEDYQLHGDQKAAYNAAFASHFGNLSNDIRIYYDKGRYIHHQMAIKQIPDYGIRVQALQPAEMWRTLGWMYGVGSDWALCREAFSSRLALLPSDMESNAGLAWCDVDGKQDIRLDDIHLPADASQQARLWLAIGYLQQAARHKKAGQVGQAMVSLDQGYALLHSVLQENKQSGLALALLADALKMRDAREKALQVYEAAASYAPYDMELVLDQAELQWDLGKPEMARQLLQRVLLGNHESANWARVKALQEKLHGEGDAENTASGA